MQALVAQLNETNIAGKSAKDVAMYNGNIRDLIHSFGGRNVHQPPEKMPGCRVTEDHHWHRSYRRR